MSDFKDRLLDEKAELSTKIDKLWGFLLSNKAKEIDPVQLSLLNIQYLAMQTYDRCLQERLLKL